MVVGRRVLRCLDLRRGRVGGVRGLRRPAGIALAHFGLVPDPQEILEEATEILTRWAEVAEAAWRQGHDIATALDSTFGLDLDGTDPVARERLETLNGIHSNAAGFRRWLDQRAGGTQPGHKHVHTR